MNLSSTLFFIGLISCFFPIEMNAQNVTISDPSFKAYLVNNTAINTNGDGEIQVSEAVAFTGTINCYFSNVNSLSGIEAFTNLTHLNCGFNHLTNLDISKNTNLTYLICNNNQLIALDLSKNTKLVNLYCYANQLASLDVSQNTSLEKLDCSLNPLGNLDLSQNTNLTLLGCGSNNLTNLDLNINTNLTILSCISNSLTNLDLSANTMLTYFNGFDNQLNTLNLRNGNNIHVTSFKATGNPNLNCIEVDDSAYSTTNWTNIDPTTMFSTDCSTFNSITTINTLPNINIFPNPTPQKLTIDLNKIYEKVAIEITNLTGQIVLNKSLENIASTTLELEGFVGMYFVKIQTEKGQQVFKVLKE